MFVFLKVNEKRGITKFHGKMAEWSIAAALKAAVGQPTSGSNPLLSGPKRSKGMHGKVTESG